MSHTFVRKLRGAGITLLVVLVVSSGARSSWAADPDVSDDKQPAAGATGEASDKPGAPPPPSAQMQLDDEGPSAQVAKKVKHGPRTAAVDDTDDKPFWKSWIFWSVTGVLVAGAVGAVLYSTSGTRGSVGPCPPAIAVSLGCYGAGRM